MSIVFFLHYYLTVFVAPLIYIVPNIHNMSKKKLLTGTLSIMTVYMVLIYFIPEYATVLGLFISSVILYVLSVNRLSAIVFAALNYICFIEVDYIALAAYHIFLGISEEEMITTASYSILFNIIVIPLFVIFSIVFSRLHLKYLTLSLSASKRIIIFASFFVTICLALFIFNISYEEQSGFPQELVMYNSIVFSLFFVLIFAALVIFIKLILKNERLKYQNLQYAALQDYTAKTEALYNSMREFKHEYLNKLLTMYFYIYDGNVDELKKYYEKAILPTKKQLEGSFQAFADLKNILVPEFKGIVYNKLIRAEELGIDINIEIKNEVNNLCSYETEITELVGIYLDNAIDETVSDNPNKKNHISFVVFDDKDTLTITISNSTFSNEIDIKRLARPGYSTRGESRGMGLYIAKNLLDKCPAIIHNTYVRDNIFYQVLRIERKPLHYG